jgi:hypothetical protein
MVSWPPHAPGGSSGTSPWAWTSVSSTSRYGADPVNQPCLQSAPHVVLRGEDQWPWLVDRGRRPAALIGYIWPAGAGRAALAKVFHAGQTSGSGLPRGFCAGRGHRPQSSRSGSWSAAAPCNLGPGRIVWRDHHGRSDMAVSRCPGPRTAVAHRRQPIPVRRLRTFADAQASDAPVTSRPMIVIAAEAGT